MGRLFARGQSKVSNKVSRSISVSVSILMFAGLLVSLPQAPVVAQESGSQHSQAPASIPGGPNDKDRYPKEYKEEEDHGPPFQFSGKPGHDKSVEGMKEIPDLRTQTGRVFDVPGMGADVAQIFTSPINYIGDDGEWHPIETDLVQVPGGWRNAANSFDIFLPDKYTSGRGVTATYPEGSFTAELDGVKPADAQPGDASVTYADVFEHTDALVAMTSTGYKEELILDSAAAPSSFEWTLVTDGLVLSEQLDGSIDVSAGETSVATIPAPIVYDQDIDLAGGVETDLVQQSPNRYHYSVSVPSSWLNDPATVFPVTVDPTLVHKTCRSNDPCGTDEGNPLLKDISLMSDNNPAGAWATPTLAVGTQDSRGKEAQTFMAFDIRQEVRKMGNLIYDASFGIYAGTRQGTSHGNWKLERISQPWADPTASPPTWATRPPVGTSSAAVTKANGCVDPPASCADAGWMTWDVTGITQDWINAGISPESNHGWRMSNTVSSAGYRTFASGEATNIDQKPYMTVLVNAMPSTRPFSMTDPNWMKLDLADDALPDGATVEGNRPTFKIKDLTDKNGSNDEIVVRYEVAKDANFSNVVWSSGWVDEVSSYTMPSGFLHENHTYYWRVAASDLCNGAGEGAWVEPSLDLTKNPPLCSDKTPTLLGGRPVSAIRSFTISDSQRGRDRRWAMENFALGNDMTASVNDANGNLLVEYPVDSLTVPGGSLNIELSYNSHAADDDDKSKGLPKGWELSAGADAGPDQIPTRLSELPGGTAVRITYASGKRETYVETSPGRFATVGPMAGVVRHDASGHQWTLTTYSGGLYHFDAAGALKGARGSTSLPTKAGFTYDVSGDGRLNWVQDQLGRRVSFFYDGSGFLSSIRRWGGGADTWLVSADSAGIHSITDPTSATVDFDYTSGSLTQIDDGYGDDTFDVHYHIDHSRPVVDTVTEPGVAHGWSFLYHFFDDGTSQESSLAEWTEVTDPRGVATTGEGENDDFMRRIEFTEGGLPIEVRGPRIDIGWPGEQSTDWPVTRMVWDENGNLICQRDPGATMIADGQEACLMPDGMQSEFEYQKRAPFLILKETGPAPTSGADGQRLVTTYEYDQGTTGVQVQYFKSAVALQGLPADVAIRDTLGESTFPTEVTSARYFGEIKPDAVAGPGSYEFKVTGTGARIPGGTTPPSYLLAVGSKVVVTCLANQTCQTQGNVSLAAGTQPVVLEVLSGTATVTWKKPGAGSFEAIPSASLAPNTDALTRETVKSKGDPTVISDTSYGYDPAVMKIRRLPTTIDLSGQNMPQGHEVTTLTYDADGRVLTEEDGLDHTTTHQYFDPSDPNDSKGVCERSTIDRVGLETKRECFPTGDVRWEEVTVQGIKDEGNNDPSVRRTDFDYDELGRATEVSYPDGGLEKFDYYGDGRLFNERTKVSASDDTDEEMRTVTYEYDPAGNLVKKTLPDPDGTGRPGVTFTPDLVGNVETREDERGSLWQFTYNAANGVQTKVEPLGDDDDTTFDGAESKTTEFRYDTAGRMTARRAPQMIQGVGRETVTKSYDVLGRVTQRKLGDLDPKEFFYDARGLVTTETDPDDIDTEFEYDAAGRLRTETAKVDMTGCNPHASPGCGEDATRTLTYDVAGWLEKETDFRNKETTYTRDGEGRPTVVTFPEVKVNEPHRAEYTYNEAGELESSSIPRVEETENLEDYEKPIAWRGDYDVMGRLKLEEDGVGNVTTYDYDLAGQLLVTHDPRSLEIHTDYYDNGWTRSRSVIDGNDEEDRIDYFYDPAGNMLSATNDHGTVSVTYDAAGRIDHVTDPDGGSTDYGYTSHRLTSVVDPSGETEYSYEATTGRLTSIKDPLTTAVDPNAGTSFTYKDSGRLLRRTEPSGAVHDYDYDAAGRRMDERVMKGQTFIADFEQTYDQNGRVLTRSTDIENGAHDGTWTYTYDDAGRMVTATATAGSGFDVFEYGYDPAGNRVDVEEDPRGTSSATVQTKYDAAGRPFEATRYEKINDQVVATVTTDYQHDKAGNLRSMSDKINGSPTTGTIYSYDGFSRLIEVSDTIVGQLNPLGQTLTYDALDRVRTTSTSLSLPGQQTQFVTKTSLYRGIAEELVETDTSVNLTGDITSIDANYALAPEGVLAQKDSVTTPLGSTTTSLELIGSGPHQDVTYLTGMNGQVVGSKAYDPWGVVIAESGTESSDLGFQSDPTDENTGLVDMGARHYLPEFGRFLTQDPMRGEPMESFSGNRFIYGLDDPASLWDPTGLCPNPEVCGPDFRTDEDHQRTQEKIIGQTISNWSFGIRTVHWSDDDYFDGEKLITDRFEIDLCQGPGERFVESLSYAHGSNVGTLGKIGVAYSLKLIAKFKEGGIAAALSRAASRTLITVSGTATAVDVGCDYLAWGEKGW